jgi:hypothetical protein
MPGRIVLTLDAREKGALNTLAKQELREPREQARFILRQELERRGLLPDDRQPETAVKGVRNDGQ